MTREEKVDLVRRAIDQVRIEGPRWLLDHYDEFFTEDFRWTSAMVGRIEGGHYVGRAGFARFWDDFEAGFTGFEVFNERFRTVDDHTLLVLLRIRVQGAESGVPVEQDIGWMFHFDGERIAAGESHTTWAAAEKAAEGRAHA